MDSRMDLESCSMMSELMPLHSSLSFISVQSLSSARGSTPLRKRRRYYDATKPMDASVEQPLWRLQCWRGLHKCGIVQVGNRETDSRTRITIEDYLKNLSRSPSSIIKPRKEFPSLRSKSKTVTNIKQRHVDQFFKEHQNRRDKIGGVGKGVTFNLDGRRKLIPAEAVKCQNEKIPQSQSAPPPALTPRAGHEKLLLRRPVKAEHSLKIDDDYVISIAQSIQLKPIIFKNAHDQYVYYSHNFPLLLDAQSDDKPVARRRTPTPEIMEGKDPKRDVKLKTRLNLLESSLNILDKETEDVDFQTVLRDDEFYPNKWPWNEKKPSDHELAESPTEEL